MKFMTLAAVSLLGFAPALPAEQNAASDDPLPQPFTARYAVIWKGMQAGATELQLQRSADGRYDYVSRTNARGLFRMALSNKILQTSTLEVTPQGVRPMRYEGDDGSEKTDRDVNLNFDWQAGEVSGVAEDNPVKLPLSAGMQDPMSIQLALIHALRAGERPSGYEMVDKDEIKTYDYTYEGEETLETVLGTVKTVLYSSHKQGSTRRVTRMWHAPSLGYIPVKAERLKEGKREWLMEIRSLDQLDQLDQQEP